MLNWKETIKKKVAERSMLKYQYVARLDDIRNKLKKESLGTNVYSRHIEKLFACVKSRNNGEITIRRLVK